MLKQANRAPGTHKAYASDWRSFEAWCASTGRSALPATSDTIELYLTARIQEGRAINSVGRYLAAIAHYHRLRGLPVPDRLVARAIVSGAQRQRGEQPAGKNALTPEQLRKICVRWAAKGTARAERDRALLTLGFATGLRRSNLIALELADLTFSRKGVAVHIRRSKTDQESKGQVIGVFRGVRPETCPVRALRSWLKFRGDAPGALFTGVTTGGKILPRHHLCGEWPNRVVKAGAVLLKLDPADYGAHSLRAGFVTAADNAGASTLAIMERTGHTTVQMVERYRRNRDPFARNPLPAVM